MKFAKLFLKQIMPTDIHFQAREMEIATIKSCVRYLGVTNRKRVMIK